MWYLEGFQAVEVGVVLSLKEGGSAVGVGSTKPTGKEMRLREVQGRAKHGQQLQEGQPDG